MRRLAPAVTAFLALALPAAAAAQGGGSCFGETDANSVEQRQGPNLRFGITPGVPPEG